MFWRRERVFLENTARVIHPEFAAGRRILAVSDIHGNLPFFRGLLQKVRFTPEDILVLDGDMLEKGRDSLALLRYLMELSRTHTVYPICGNCDGLVFRFFGRAGRPVLRQLPPPAPGEHHPSAGR